LDSRAGQHGSKKATLIVAREEKIKYTQNYAKLDTTIELTLDITKIYKFQTVYTMDKLSERRKIGINWEAVPNICNTFTKIRGTNRATRMLFVYFIRLPTGYVCGPLTNKSDAMVFMQPKRIL